MKTITRLLLASVVFLASGLSANAETFVFNGIEVNSIELKGSIVPAGTTLDYKGDGVWRSTVNLSKFGSNEYPGRYFYFTLNGDDSKALRRIVCTNDIRLDTGQGLENIRLNNGIYDITLDLNNLTYGIEGDLDPMKISVFGSSVANGQGADSFHGYAYLYGEQLKERNASGISPNALYTSGVSIGGNTTTALKNRYIDILHDFGKYVIIGLSMANEGLPSSSDKQAVFTQFRDKMLSLISSLREDGKTVVVMNNYTNSDYGPADYEKIKAINLLIHEWDVPSFNTLGAIDDGSGHWAPGYLADGWHPNNAGHQEFMYAMVPSLFDALIQDKPLPVRDRSQSIVLGKGETIEITPEGVLHPFTLALRLNVTSPGKILSFNQGTGRLASTPTLFVDENGVLNYARSASSNPISTGINVLDGEWHDVALSHYYARGMTKIYVDGKEVASSQENINFNSSFIIGDTDNSSSLELGELFLWRAGMNEEEMAALSSGSMLKSSLEIYAPMKVDTEGTIPNLAQSTNTIRYNAVPGNNDSEDSGIHSQFIQEYPAKEGYIDLFGTQVSSPVHGKIYIRQSGSKFEKIIY